VKGTCDEPVDRRRFDLYNGSLLGELQYQSLTFVKLGEGFIPHFGRLVRQHRDVDSSYGATGKYAVVL
jgi:hypothetical protein